MIEGNGGRLCEEEGPWLIGLRCCLRHARWGGGLQRLHRCLRLSSGPGLVFPCDRARLRQSAVQVIPEFGYLREAMMRSPSSFLDAVRPYPRGFRLSYLFMSVSIVVLEVVFHAISAPLGTHDILILAALCALLSAGTLATPDISRTAVCSRVRRDGGV